MGCRRAVSLLAALLSSAPLAARAEPTDPPTLPIALELSGCDALDQRETLKLLAIEFQTLNVEPRTPPERARISCGPSVARITIDDRATSNEVQLAATSASAWPRLLALSVSELVIESRSQIAAPQSPPPIPEARAPVRARAGRRKVRLFVGYSPLRVQRAATWLEGPVLGLELDWTRNVSVLAQARLAYGSTDSDVAKVRWLSTRAELAALLGFSVGAWRARFGPGFALGYLRLSPTVSQLGATPHVVDGAWGGPELTELTEYTFSARCFLRLNTDIGLVVLPVTGRVNGERRLVDAGGVWISAGFALGAAF